MEVSREEAAEAGAAAAAAAEQYLATVKAVPIFQGAEACGISLLSTLFVLSLSHVSIAIFHVSMLCCMIPQYAGVRVQVFGTARHCKVSLFEKVPPPGAGRKADGAAARAGGAGDGAVS
eukprot:TRINITY_DN306_c4_g1_i3.p1 TRINITY_DN306_c4_g1~~TRINITY_DN306_c4_g1_i3.p1  ORF type:complete len:119 (-),score=23.04 TRINITY_DN306_c4_g1_i3:121-477(-)